MKILFLNPPYHEKIMRRYISSYYAPNFLLPPYELMSLAAIAGEWKKCEVRVIDAIALNYKLEKVIEEIVLFNPELIVSMPGFESFSEDIETLNCIKQKFPEKKVVIFGYIPSLFAEEVLRESSIDIIIRGEPEKTFCYFIDQVKTGGLMNSQMGIAYREDSKIIVNPVSLRINELDDYPFPDPLAVNLELYREPYLGRSVMAFYSSRGCSGTCNYCIKSFGAGIHFISPENTVKKIIWYYENFNIKNFRFLDDNFTADKNRVLEICKLIEEKKIKIQWTCLSRIDTLDDEIVMRIKKAGCKRIYLGIESGSQRILDFYGKKYTVEDIRSRLKILRKAGIDFTGFFIVGAPLETIEDVGKSIELAIKEDFDFIIVTRLKFIPGTELFEQYKDRIKFSLFPYKIYLDSSEYESKTLEWEKLFYRRFYFRKRYYYKKFKLIFTSPLNIIEGIRFLIKFLKDKKRRDLI